MKVVINDCYGGFGLSDEAYEKLIEWGVPVKTYIREERDPKTGLFPKDPRNEGEVIFDRTKEKTSMAASLMSLSGRYWDTWLAHQRTHPLLVRVVEELGHKASGRFSSLKVVDIPDGVDYSIEEYDGLEHIAETHRTWS